MTEYKFSDESLHFSCPAEALANLLGRKWVPQIIEQLSIKSMRFGELVRNLPGSTPKMVKQQLNLLIKNQIVNNEKTIIQNTIESTYQLTNKGIELSKIVKQMQYWGQINLKC